MPNQSIQVELAAETEKTLLRNLMQAYRHDLSEFDGSLPEPDGLYSLGNHFDDYWIEPNRFPYKITVDSRIAGCALVRKLKPSVHSIAEFFILRPYRNSGIGKEVAYWLFHQYPGEWRVSQDEGNLAAQAFWRKIIGELTRGEYRDNWSDAHPTGPMQVFNVEGKKPN